MRLPVDDKRYRQLVDWLANEHKVLSQTLRREPTDEEHRVHAHAFVDLVFGDQAKAGADGNSVTDAYRRAGARHRLQELATQVRI